MAIKPKQEYLSRKELCEVLGISQTTFARDKIGEKLPVYKIGSRFKYKKSDIELFLARKVERTWY